MKNFNFGENLRRIRVQKGISQDAIAMNMDITQTKYSRMERSECVPEKIYVDRAANCLEVSANDLIPPGWDYTKNPTKLQESMTRPAIIAYRILLFVAFFDMARGFCDGAGITSMAVKIGAVIGFEGMAVAFIYLTEKGVVKRFKKIFVKGNTG